MMTHVVYSRREEIPQTRPYQCEPIQRNSIRPTIHAVNSLDALRILLYCRGSVSCLSKQPVQTTIGKRISRKRCNHARSARHSSFHSAFSRSARFFLTKTSCWQKLLIGDWGRARTYLSAGHSPSLLQTDPVCARRTISYPYAVLYVITLDHATEYSINSSNTPGPECTEVGLSCRWRCVLFAESREWGALRWRLGFIGVCDRCQDGPKDLGLSYRSQRGLFANSDRCRLG